MYGSIVRIIIEKHGRTWEENQFWSWDLAFNCSNCADITRMDLGCGGKSYFMRLATYTTLVSLSWLCFITLCFRGQSLLNSACWLVRYTIFLTLTTSFWRKKRLKIVYVHVQDIINQWLTVFKVHIESDFSLSYWISLFSTSKPNGGKSVRIRNILQ